MNDNDTKKDNKNFLKYKAKIDEIFKNQKGNQFLFFLEKKKNRLSKKLFLKLKKKMNGIFLQMKLKRKRKSQLTKQSLPANQRILFKKW